MGGKVLARKALSIGIVGRMSCDEGIYSEERLTTKLQEEEQRRYQQGGVIHDVVGRRVNPQVNVYVCCTTSPKVTLKAMNCRIQRAHICCTFRKTEETIPRLIMAQIIWMFSVREDDNA